MGNLPDEFDVHLTGIETQDIANALRRLRAHGLLGAFLSHPEVLGDDTFYLQARRDGTAETFREYAARSGNGKGFVVRLERNCVAVTPLGPAEPPDPAV